MANWEYLTVIFSSDYHKDKLCLIVNEVNGENASFRDEAGTAYTHELHEYLEIIGKEGWEAVGISPLNIAATGFIKTSLMLLKRAT